jgi:hypothetical protein
MFRFYPKVIRLGLVLKPFTLLVQVENEKNSRKNKGNPPVKPQART